MGLLSENAGFASVAEQAQSSRSRMIVEAGRTFEENYADKPSFSGLRTQFESQDEKSQLVAARTIVAVEQTRQALDHARNTLGEATVQASLGALNPRVLDIVRVFYPNIIAQELCDIQPLTGQVGQIFVVKPRYAGPVTGVPGVTVGQQMFTPSTYATNNNYASELNYLQIGTGNSSATVFTSILAPAPIRPGSVTITAATVVATDNGSGVLSGTGIASGTVNYTNGAVTITYSTAPVTAVAITAAWRANSEIGQQSIRSIDFDITLIPVQAKLYPLTFSYSVAAGLAAQAHLALDVQDTLTNEAATMIKVERDNRIVQLIAANATHDATLDFNASMTSVNYDKRSKFGEIEIKIDVAISLIQAAVGRGGVDYVLCGINAATIFSNCRTFQAEPVRAPIGSYKLGTLRDGTIAVIKSLTLDANTVIFGFKGYTAGDAAVVLAEWIPLYSTPLFQNPTLVNQQGLCSMYDLFVNQSSYFYYGTVSNFAG